MADQATEMTVFFAQWLERTEQILHGQLDKKKIGITEDLKRSLHSEMTSMAMGYLRGEISFLQRGRFVDMGAGRGLKSERSLYDMEQGINSRRGRKAKKWYSRAFYGRLNDLEGAIGMSIMNQVLENTINNLKGA